VGREENSTVLLKVETGGLGERIEMKNLLFHYLNYSRERSEKEESLWEEIGGKCSRR